MPGDDRSIGSGPGHNDDPRDVGRVPAKLPTNRIRNNAQLLRQRPQEILQVVERCLDLDDQQDPPTSVPREDVD